MSLNLTKICLLNKRYIFIFLFSKAVGSSSHHHNSLKRILTRIYRVSLKFLVAFSLKYKTNVLTCLFLLKKYNVLQGTHNEYGGGIWSTSILEDYLIKMFKTKDIKRESLSKKNLHILCINWLNLKTVQVIYEEIKKNFSQG